MAQFLALEWNRDEVLVAVASQRGHRVVVEHAFALSQKEDAVSDAASTNLGEQIAKELKERGVSCSEAMVGVGRGGIELRQISLPPAPEDDLPDMVRFQAGREFNEFDDRWLLDFIPLSAEADGRRTVLAAAIAPSSLRQIEEMCQQAGLKMRQLFLGPCEAAVLTSAVESAVPGAAKATSSEPLRLQMIVCSREVELTVLSRGAACFLRSMRFSGASPHQSSLLSEIRLTMAAVAQQFPGREIESIFLCGNEPEYLEWAKDLHLQLGIPVETYDPFAAVEVSASLKKQRPAHVGRYTPLLGMFSAEFRRIGHVVDFLHPRRRPEPPSRKRTWGLAGAAALTIFFVILAYNHLEYNRLVDEVAELTRTSADLEPKIGRAKQVRANAAEMSKWTNGDMVWLDQLYQLNKVFPPTGDALVEELRLDTTQPSGPQMLLKGHARDAEVVAKMEERIRSGGGQIVATNGQEDDAVKGYRWKFEARLIFKKEAKP